MKAMWFLPFTFAAGAEGFALFAAYLLGLLTVLYFVRASRQTRALLLSHLSPLNTARALPPIPLEAMAYGSTRR